MRQQVTRYVCNQCKRTLSDESRDYVNVPHWSIKIGNPSGFVKEISNQWRFQQRFQATIYHFCDEGCLAKFFARAREPVDE